VSRRISWHRHDGDAAKKCLCAGENMREQIFTLATTKTADFGVSLRDDSAAATVFLRVKNMRLHLYTFVFFVLVGSAAQAAKPVSAVQKSTCQPDADWNEPAPPLHIYGNTWYVGTCGLSAVLITSAHGHILIDGDTEKAPPLIEANIRKLGFRVADVRYILNSHAHHDHAGGLAQLQQDSGAVVVARGADADAIERGQGDRSDPQYLESKKFPPVSEVRRVVDGEIIMLDGLALTAHATPGHTPGSTSWTWTSCEGKRCLQMAYVDSVTPLSDDVYRYTDEVPHPGVVAAFRAGLATIAALPCDILLTPHPDASAMWTRLGAQTTAPLIDADACRRYAASGSEKLDTRIAREHASAP